MAVRVRLHLMNLEGIRTTNLDLDIGGSPPLANILASLDGRRVAEKGFFRMVLRGKAPVTVLLNGERLDPIEDKDTEIRDGDELVILSPVTGG